MRTVYEIRRPARSRQDNFGPISRCFSECVALGIIDTEEAHRINEHLCDPQIGWLKLSDALEARVIELLTDADEING